MELVKIFSGSQIIVQAIQVALLEIEITSFIKNHIQSAAMAGFGSAGLAIDVYVPKKDVLQAKLIVTKISGEHG